MSEQQDENSSQIKSYPNKGLAKSGRKLYLNTKSSDVKFSFGTGDGRVKRVAAHKNLLAATSDVFEAMFYGDLKETGDIPITDATEAAFMEFLQFFYLDEVKLTKENIAGVMYLGHKYQVKDCIDECIQFLKDNVTPANVLIGLDLAILYDHHGLLKFCEKIIVINTAAVRKSDAFLNCSNAALDHILKMDVLSCSEVEVFEACMAWVKAKSGKAVLKKELVSVHLGELFYKIRFASMTMPQLCSLLTEYDSVMSDDFKLIAQIISVPGFQSDKFNVNLRQPKWDKDAVIECDRALTKEFITNSFHAFYMEKTIFSTNEPLLLGSFTCEKVANGSASSVFDWKLDWPVKVYIIEAADRSKNATGEVLSKIEVGISKSTSTNIQLPHPILIRPWLFYRISIGPFPEGYRYCSKHLKDALMLGGNIKIQFHHVDAYDINDKEIEVGLISTLNFNRI